MPFVTSGARDIYFEQHGSGPALVLLHGAGSNAATWWQQLGPLSRHFSCYTLDQRCFGRSVAPLEEFRIEHFVQDVIALLDAQGLSQAMLLGQSLGGMVALRATLDHPNRVSALVLCDSPLAIDHPRQLAMVRERVTKAAALTIEQRSLGQWCLDHRPELAVLYGQINHFNPNFYRQNAAAWQAAMTRLSEPDQLTPMAALRSVACPTLIIVGEDDPIVPVDVMQDVQAHIAGSELRVIANAAHSAYFEQSDAFNREVLGFLQSRGRG
jgi:3-oxoadipate enol-lactonase